MNQIIKTKKSGRQKSKIVLLWVLPLGLSFFVFNCSTPKTKDRSGCKADQKLSSFWEDLNLPKVEGAVLCNEFRTENLYSNVEFIHYRNEDQHFRDFYQLWEEAFKRNDWRIQKIAPQQGSMIVTLDKRGKGFLAILKDCMDSKNSDERLCSSVTITECRGGDCSR